MFESAKRWSVCLVALLAAGPVVYALTAGLGGPAPAFHTPGLLSANPALGLARAVAAILLAGAIGLVAGRVTSLRTGFFATGLALAWGAWGQGSLDELTRSMPASQLVGGWIRVALEGGLLGFLAIGVALLLIKIARPSGLRPLASSDPAPVSRAILAAGAGVLLLGVLAWVVAQNSRPGQALAAGVIGSIGVMAMTIAIHHRLSPVWAVVAAATMAALGPVIGLAVHGFDGARLTQAVFSGGAFPTLRLLPMHWLAGAFLGVPFGISLGQWLVSHKFHTEQHPIESARLS